MKNAVLLAIILAVSSGAAGRTMAQSFSIPMDQQIDVGMGPAIGPHGQVVFTSDATGGFARFPIAGGGYYWGPFISLVAAGIGPIDLSDPTASIEFDARYYQDSANYPEGTPWNNHDAPIGVLLMSPTAGVAYGYPYHSVWGDPPFPTWTHIALEVNAPAAPKVQTWAWWGTMDMSEITAIQFWGTDWAGRGADFIDVRNVTFNTTATRSSVPEIDPAGFGAGLALVGGALGLLERRRPRPG